MLASVREAARLDLDRKHPALIDSWHISGYFRWQNSDVRVNRAINLKS
jgi:hypothetical protein